MIFVSGLRFGRGVRYRLREPGSGFGSAGKGAKFDEVAGCPMRDANGKFGFDDGMFGTVAANV